LRLSNEERKRRAANVAFMVNPPVFTHSPSFFWVFADGVAKKHKLLFATFENATKLNRIEFV